MELLGKIKNCNLDFYSGKAVLEFEIDNKEHAINCYEELRSAEKLTIKVSKYKEKRSLDSNGYFWKLADKLANKLNKSKEEIYRECIRDIGGVSDIVCIQEKAVKKLCDSWSAKGIGWQTETMPSKIEGCVNVVLYYGSSTYNSIQMNRLIENIIQECKAQGIDTITPAEQAKMMSLWGGK